jgi:hypothetical protein
VTTYFVDSQTWRDTFYAEHTNFSRGFGRNGVVVIDINDIERLATSGRLSPHDIIVTLANEDDKHFLDAVSPCNRWLATVDESGKTWQVYERQVERCRKWDMRGVVTTYWNVDHLSVLDKAGLKHVAMPPCIEGLRPRAAKSRHVILSGRIDVKETPERARLVTLLRIREPELTKLLPHPGTSKRDMCHAYVGSAYLALLDGFEMGTIDCYGWRDRMVAKYVEFAAARVLPIGSCPTYMPQEMKEAMLDTVRLSDDEVVHEVKRLLSSPIELKQRQDQYSASALQHFQLDDNARRALTSVQRLSSC